MMAKCGGVEPHHYVSGGGRLSVFVVIRYFEGEGSII